MPSRTPSAAHRGMGVHGLRTGMNHPSGACSALAPDADFRRKMPCEARQAGSVLKPGDEKAHGRVAEPIPDGQQPLAHEGGSIVPVP